MDKDRRRDKKEKDKCDMGGTDSRQGHGTMGDRELDKCEAEVLGGGGYGVRVSHNFVGCGGGGGGGIVVGGRGMSER